MIDVIIIFSIIGTGVGYYVLKKAFKKTTVKNIVFKNRFKINKKNIKKYNLEGETCCICLDDYHLKCENHKECDPKCYQLFCNHIYHKKCIMEWLNQDVKCPLCNVSIKTKYGKTFEELQEKVLEERIVEIEERRIRDERRRRRRINNRRLVNMHNF
jgi:hypothetical protein